MRCENGIGYNFCRPMKARSDLAPDKSENTAPEKHLETCKPGEDTPSNQVKDPLHPAFIPAMSTSWSRVVVRTGIGKYNVTFYCI